MSIGKKLLNAIVSGIDIIDDRIDFDSITGGQQNAFSNALIGTQTMERFTQPASRNREFFPHFNRSSLVAQSDDDNMHVRQAVRGL